MVMAGAMLNAVLLSILAEIPSGPFDLLTPSDESKTEISSSLQSSSLEAAQEIFKPLKFCAVIQGTLMLQCLFLYPLMNDCSASKE